MGSGKSWRTTGILYVLEASFTSGAVRRHIGHSRSSNTTIATCDPLGGRSTESTVSCAAQRPAATSNTAAVDKIARRFQILVLMAILSAMNIRGVPTINWTQKSIVEQPVSTIP